MKWVQFDGSECPNCGGACEVFTKSKEENWVYDGEEARCKQCGHQGYVDADGEIADIIWYDEEDMV